MLTTLRNRGSTKPQDYSCLPSTGSAASAVIMMTSRQVTFSDIVLILRLRAQAGEGLPETFFGSPLKKLDLLSR